MRRLLVLAVAALPALAAVSGTVINQTTGKPQAGATVGLNRLGKDGIELIDQAKSDAQGNFTINQDTQGPPHLLRTAYDGVTYNHMLPPGSPTSGLTVQVYNASKQPGDAKVAKHMLLFEPAAGEMVVNETYLLENSGKTAWYDPTAGTLQFFLPAGTNGKVQVTATAPGGAPIGAAVVKTSKANIHAVDFPVKPGDTRVDLTYTFPYKPGEPYEGKIVSKDENTYLIAPNGVTLAGANLTDLGTEPRTQAHIFGFAGSSFKIQLTGTGAAAPAAAGAEAGSAEEQDSGPQIEQILPRVYGKQLMILALAFGILGLGFAILYRAHPAPDPAKEPHARRK